jgi:hypothetical protein
VIEVAGNQALEHKPLVMPLVKDKLVVFKKTMAMLFVVVAVAVAAGTAAVAVLHVLDTGPAVELVALAGLAELQVGPLRQANSREMVKPKSPSCNLNLHKHLHLLSCIFLKF